MAESKEPFLVVKDLYVRYGTKVILDRVSISLEKGRTLVLMGLSGAGKSTLIRCIIGLQKPVSGHIFVNGTDILTLNRQDMDRFREKVGMVFQYSALFDSLSILENVAFGLREHTRLSEDVIRRRVLEALATVDLSGTENLFPSQLSGGMQKRAGFARAIVTDPELILYDEPTSGLDPIMSSIISELINNLKSSMGVTSIVVTHDLKSAYTVGDKIALLHQGRFIETGDAETFRNSENPVTKQFVEGLPYGPVKM